MCVVRVLSNHAHNRLPGLPLVYIGATGFAFLSASWSSLIALQCRFDYLIIANGKITLGSLEDRIYAPYPLDKSKKGDDVVIEGGATIIGLINKKYQKEDGEIDQGCFPHVIQHKNDKDKLLANTKAGDVVYITGHGNTNVIGSQDDRASLTPEDLAKQLKEVGLHKDVSKVKVITCHSGTKEFNMKTYKDHCYAQNLCIELSKLGQSDTTIVSGYPGSISTTDKKRTWMDGDDTGIGVGMKGGNWKNSFSGKTGMPSEDNVSCKRPNQAVISAARISE